MKATIDIPDDLYRRVKARSAMEGRALRSVAIDLFESWLREQPSAKPPRSPGMKDRPPTRFDDASWAKIARRHMNPEASHDLDEIRESVARGWMVETSEKLAPKTRRK